MKIFKKKDKKEAKDGKEKAVPNAPVAAGMGSSTTHVNVGESEAESELKKTRLALDEARAVMREQSKRCSASERDRADIEMKLTLSNERLASSKEENDRLVADLEAASDAKKELERKVSKLELELEKTKAALLERMENHRSEMDKRTEQPGSNRNIVDARENSQQLKELEKELESMKKHKAALEKDLSHLTGLQVTDAQIRKVEDEKAQLMQELEEERSTSRGFRVRIKQLEKDSESTLEMMQGTRKEESNRRILVEEELQKTQERSEELEQELASLKHTSLAQKMTSDEEAKSLRAEVAQLQNRIEQQKIEFDKLEKQRLASLDNNTASLLQAEREKVEMEEKRKRDIEVEQIMQDQRQAMEAIVAAVRAEEQMKVATKPREVFSPIPEEVPSPSSAPTLRGEPTIATSNEKKSSYYGPFSFFYGRQTAENSESGDKVDVPKSAPVDAPKPATNAVSKPVLSVAPTASVVPKVTSDSFSGKQTSAKEPVSAAPKRFQLVDDLTENTADVARASLDYMSL